jgi:hypothetical protein
VLWDHRDPFDGEDQPPAAVTWPWPAEAAVITDAFGHSRIVPSPNAELNLLLTDTPLLIETASEAVHTTTVAADR